MKAALALLAALLLLALPAGASTRSSDVVVVNVTKELGCTVDAPAVSYGDCNALDGADIQAAICSNDCDSKCALILEPGTYENVNISPPHWRPGTHNPASCDTAAKNECDRLGYDMTGTQNRTDYLEIQGAGEGRTILRAPLMAAADYDNDECASGSATKWHLQGVITLIPSLGGYRAIRDLTIDGRLSEQPIPPGDPPNPLRHVGFNGIVHTSGGSEDDTLDVSNVTIRNVVRNGLSLGVLRRALVSGVAVTNVGINKSEPGHVNAAWNAAEVPETENYQNLSRGIGAVISDDISVYKSVFDSATKIGLECLGCDNVTVAESTFRRARIGLAFNDFGGPPTIKKVRVLGNLFSTNGLSIDNTNLHTGRKGYGMEWPGTLEVGTSAEISDNTFIGNLGGAMFLLFGNLNGKPVTINNNTISGNCQIGDKWNCFAVQLGGTDGASTDLSTLTWSNNTIAAPTGPLYGLYIEDAVNLTLGTGNSVTMPADSPAQMVVFVNDSDGVVIGNGMQITSTTGINAVLFNANPTDTVVNSSVAAGALITTAGAKCIDQNAAGSGNSFDATACGLTPSLLIQNIVGATRSINTSDSAPNGSFEIANDGSAGTSVNYTVSVDASPDVCDGVSKTNWITATGTGNVLKGGTPATIALTYDTAACVAGTYNGTVRVTSTNADDSPKTIAITLVVTAASGPLLVDAGGPYSCEACTSIPISCIAADGTPPYTTYLWEWQSQTGPCASAAITSTSSASTTITGLVSSYDATCQIKCTVTDTDTNQASDIDGVTVNPPPLVATLSNSQTTTTAGTLRGSCSGGDGTYQWTVIEKSGPNCDTVSWATTASCVQGTTATIETPYTWSSVNPTQSCTVELTCDDTGVQACP